MIAPTTTARVQGGDLTEILARAAEQFDAYFGKGSEWEITEVTARPIVWRLGFNVPALWEADVEAEGSL